MVLPNSASALGGKRDVLILGVVPSAETHSVIHK